MDNPVTPAAPGTGLGLTQYVGGIVAVKSAAQMAAEDRANAEVQNSRPYIVNLASHIKTKWSAMKDSKSQKVEPRLLQCLRQRRGEYDPEVLKDIASQGGSSIYLMLSSNKARAASSWVRDVMSGTGSDKPWAITPTPVPDIPPNIVQTTFQSMAQELQQAAALGVMPTPEQLEEFIGARKDMVMNTLREEARERSLRMERKMEDQLAEGAFNTEFNKFIDDLATFPYAVMKGPVVKRQKTFKWVPSKVTPGEFELETADELLPTWERVDPFMIYWAAHSANPDDGDLIQRHRLTRSDLNAMLGVEGYSDSAIRAVLEEHGGGGLQEWLWVDSAKADAEGKDQAAAMQNPDGLIDAIQFWGSVQGKLLVEWGIDEKQIEDPLLDYPVEAWLIGTWVIKAIINPDPLARKPYYKTSYEEIPGSWMGNSPMDLIRDCQSVCNAVARAMVNNMGISSGPQVWVNVDRLPAGEQITHLYPWKIHQVTSDPLGGSAQPPIGFFQPNSMSQELMAVYEKFAVLADEYSGVPRYMTGDAPAGGAGRTASGMNMLMNNAGKAIKQVIANIDRNVIEPLIERLWHYNMKYSQDTDLKGDVKIVARGANSLLIKETAAQRRNELLQMALNSPVAQQIMGMDGTAYLLREQVKTLEMNADRIVPPPEVVKARMMVQQAQQMAAMQQQNSQPDEQMDIHRDETGQMTKMSVRRRPSNPTSQSGQNLQNGAPIVDNFSPMRGVSS